ncbi:MAG TPA: glycosyltransferase [Cyclobacteriaceae bacterium]|nr:glycosyltransferase [Cyclobacteriaceae bacterium]
MPLVLGFIFFAYVLLIIFLLLGWDQVVLKTPPSSRCDETITVLIPVRNEEENIVKLLSDIQKQTDKSFEVIVIDDHSDDNTCQQVVAVIANGFENLRITRLTETFGKKSALTLGVEEAKGSLIVTTDADCRVDRLWLSGFRECFSDSSVLLAFGAVRIGAGGTLWTSMQAIELASLIGSGAGTLGLGFPTMCNGANLAYRKEAFLAVGGYSGNESIPSGDDEFLMRKIHSRFPGSIRFVASAENVVETNPVSFTSFIHQRIRWAGKWRLNSDVYTKLLALFVGFFHLSYLLALIMLMLRYNFILLLTVVTSKSFLEFVLLRKVMRFLNSPWSWSAFIILQFIYPFYVVSIGVLANLKSPIWKGRKIRRTGWQINPVLRQNH